MEGVERLKYSWISTGVEVRNYYNERLRTLLWSLLWRVLIWRKMKGISSCAGILNYIRTTYNLSLQIQKMPGIIKSWLSITVVSIERWEMINRKRSFKAGTIFFFSINSLEVSGIIKHPLTWIPHFLKLGLGDFLVMKDFPERAMLNNENQKSVMTNIGYQFQMSW